jgi:gliding motility-associated-like protein
LSGVTYEWKKDGNAIGNNSPELVVTEPGSYKVEVLTSCGLQKSDNEVKVTTQAPPPLPVTKDIENCGAGSITLAASGGTDGSYRWYTSPTGGIPISGAVNSKYVTPDLSSTTTYYVAISNGTCESERIAVQAIIHPLPTVNAGTDVAIDFGESTILRGTGTGNYQWTPAVGLSNVNAPDPVARPSETTTYTLTVTSEEGCFATDTVTVTVRKDLTIPNAFSPNGDGVNDTWQIDNIQSFPGAKLEIYNRWGSKLYEKVGYSNDWNGTYQGKELPVNTYFYLVTYSVQGQPRKLTGAVSIIR